MVFVPHPIKGLDRTNASQLSLPLKLASIGVQNLEKRSHLIENLCLMTESISKPNKLQISTIGRLHIEFSDEAGLLHVGSGMNAYLLPSSAYKRAIFEQHFILSFIGEEYDLKVSGVLFDCIRFQKPLLALRCHSTEFFLEKYGQVGELFNSVEEMAETISSYVKSPPQEMYQTMLFNLAKAVDNGDQENDLLAIGRVQ